MTISELIADYRTKAEAQYGLELVDIQAAKETCVKGPMEKFKALCSLENEIINTINEQTLLQWLIDNEVPGELYDCYRFDGVNVRFNGEVVEDAD